MHTLVELRCQPDVSVAFIASLRVFPFLKVKVLIPTLMTQTNRKISLRFTVNYQKRQPQLRRELWLMVAKCFRDNSRFHTDAYFDVCICFEVNIVEKGSVAILLVIN